MITRPADPQDAARMAEWSVHTPSNGFDPDTATYPHLFTFAIEDKDGPILYVPTHPVLVIESVACRPGITPKQYIQALLEAKRVTEQYAQQYQMREIYTSSGYAPMLRTLRRHGYEPIVGTALRKKIR